MSGVLILFAVIGCVYFGIRLVSYSGAGLADALGIAASLFVLRHNAKVLLSNRKLASTPTLRELKDAAELDDALASERAILYKHSTRCAVSAIVIDEVLRFEEAHPDWTTYVLKVIEQRELSNAVAERLGVSHESPQVFVIRQGQCVWHASHNYITAQALSQHLS